MSDSKEKSGMSVEEAKAHLEARGLESLVPGGWATLNKMQQGNGKFAKAVRNPARARAMGRPCPNCGKPSKSTCLLPLCAACRKAVIG